MERAAIEADTGRRDEPAYAVLTDTERGELLPASPPCQLVLAHRAVGVERHGCLRPPFDTHRVPLTARARCATAGQALGGVLLGRGGAVYRQAELRR
ncbi:hypothetical protein DQE82_01910 [Micromonospora sp. LHW51205]|nr:hypothetical protein DQE82_01910 [Micromonospora sp. LHW51205]